MASTAVAVLGVCANLFVAWLSGADTGLLALPTLVLILLLGILPSICGGLAYALARRRQRTGDIAFAGCMIAQGVVLLIIPFT